MSSYASPGRHCHSHVGIPIAFPLAPFLRLDLHVGSSFLQVPRSSTIHGGVLPPPCVPLAYVPFCVAVVNIHLLRVHRLSPRGSLSHSLTNPLLFSGERREGRRPPSSAVHAPFAPPGPLEDRRKGPGGGCVAEERGWVRWATWRVHSRTSGAQPTSTNRTCDVVRQRTVQQDERRWHTRV